MRGGTADAARHAPTARTACRASADRRGPAIQAPDAAPARPDGTDAHPRPHHHQRRPAQHPAGPADDPPGSAMGGQRLRPGLRRLPAAGWAARRPPGPASLSIITTAFAEGPERNRALGVWSAVLASGGAIGMLAGGLLTQYASWRWVLFVNVPVGALLLAATPRVVPAAPGEPRARIDAAGAVTVTAGLAGLVYATTQVPEHGWATPATVGFLLVAAVLLGAFLVIESRHRAPLVPLRILRRRSLTGADTVALLGGAAVIASPIFFLTLYLQQILGFSAIQAGLATLPLGLAVIVTSQLSPRIMERVGRKRLLVSGLALAAVGLALLGRIHPAGSYTVEVLGPVVLLGLGMGLSFVPLTASAVAGVPPADQGLASGLLQTAQQLGVALGLAVLTSLATATTLGLLGHPAGPPDPAALQAALTGGYAAALRGAALLALAAAALALLILPPRPAPRSRSRHRSRR